MAILAATQRVLLAFLWAALGISLGIVISWLLRAAMIRVALWRGHSRLAAAYILGVRTRELVGGSVDDGHAYWVNEDSPPSTRAAVLWSFQLRWPPVRVRGIEMGIVVFHKENGRLRYRVDPYQIGQRHDQRSVR